MTQSQPWPLSVLPERFVRILAKTVLVACGACGSPTALVRPSGGDAILPFFDTQQAELFDDAIDPAAVDMGMGLGGGRGELRDDVAFRDRAQTADGVLRARLSTVSGSGEAFVITLEPLEKLTGRRGPLEALTLRIEKTSRGFGILRAQGERLAGKTFVMFVREFAGVPPVWHIHLAPDTKDVATAVQNAVALRDLR